MLKVEPETEERLRRLARARGQSAEEILQETLEKLLGEQERVGDRHPSGKAWPRRNPVGGVITPV